MHYRMIHNAIQNFFLTLSEAIDRHFGFGLGVRGNLRIPPKGDPFIPTHLYAGQKADGSSIREQMEGFAARGWFAPGQYANHPEETAAFRKVLERSARMSPRIVVLLMPESRSLRERVPPEADSALLAAFRGEHGFDLLDCRSALSEEAFFDLVHVNSVGRAWLSSWLKARYWKDGEDRPPSTRAGGSQRPNFAAGRTWLDTGVPRPAPGRCLEPRSAAPSQVAGMVPGHEWKHSC
jgi:hypothetical protein